MDALHVPHVELPEKEQRITLDEPVQKLLDQHLRSLELENMTTTVRVQLRQALINRAVTKQRLINVARSMPSTGQKEVPGTTEQGTSLPAGGRGDGLKAKRVLIPPTL